MSLRNIITFILLMLAGGFLSNRAAADDKNLTLYKVREGNLIYLMVKLDNCSEATLTLTATMENMAASVPLPLTLDIVGQPQQALVVFKAINPNLPFNCIGKYKWQYGRRAGVTASSYAYALPYKIGPHEVIQGAYGKFSHYPGSQDEEAIDWAMLVGTAVYPARPGTVIGLRSDCAAGDVNRKGECNYIVLKHEDGTFAEYLHLKQDSVLVRLGDRVELSQPIALSGNTGFSTEPHLHFAVFVPLDGSTRKTLPVVFLSRTGKPFKPAAGGIY